MPTFETDLKPPASAGPRFRREWRRLTDLLSSRRSLDALDQMAITDLLTCWEHTLELEEKIRLEGYIVTLENGNAAQNPNVRTLMLFRRSMMMWAKELGLTLRARNNIKLAEVPAEGRDLLSSIMDDDSDTAIQ